MPVDPLPDCWRAFNREVLNMNSHDMEDIVVTLLKARLLSSSSTTCRSMEGLCLKPGVNFPRNFHILLNEDREQ